MAFFKTRIPALNPDDGELTRRQAAGEVITNIMVATGWMREPGNA